MDGFRCDVASFVPLDFWKEARAAVERVHPGFIWLAETVHRTFGLRCRRLGVYSMRDSEAFEAFDVEYEYDIREIFDAWLYGRAPLSHYLDLMNFQEVTYPANYNKLRYLENHDQPRIASFIKSESDLINYTAMLYFFKGTTMLYAGQEFENERRPSLFEKDPIDRATGKDLSALMRRLYEIKHAVLERVGRGVRKLGVFSLRSESAEVEVPASDGDYAELIGGGTVSVKNHKIRCEGRPILFTLPA